MKFEETGLNKKILQAISDLNFETLTPIQQEVIPYLLKSKTDLIALAQTGTGKTAAFGLPALHKIEISKKLPQIIILCPTRELCLQISKDMQAYAKYIDKLNITAVYGGANISPQIKSLKKGTQIIVGTPGRAIDLIKRKALKLQDIRFVILDEADEMLNMGFKDDLDTILAETPEKKQTLLFSATMPKEVMRISKNYMNQAKTIEVASRNEGTKNVDHHYYMVNAREKYNALRRICDINPEIYGIVFCRTRRETANIADKLMQDGYNADAIHGELSQSQRDHVMKRFRQKKLQILVATDVAARGLDVNNLSHVINYNLPDDNEVYVHRSGRTGRAGKKGVSIIIAHSREGKKMKDIQKMIKRDLVLQKVPNGDEICHIQLMKLVDKIVGTKTNKQIGKYLPTIEEKLSHLTKEDLIEQFISIEFNRFLSFYKNAPDLNVSHNKNETNRTEKRNTKTKRTGHAEIGYTRFFINIGKDKNLQTHNLIGLINEYTKNRNIPVGKIDIMKKFSFFEVPSDFKNDILKGLRNVKWNNQTIKAETSQTPGFRANKSRKSINIEKNKVNRKNKRNKRAEKKNSSFKAKFNAAKRKR